MSEDKLGMASLEVQLDDWVAWFKKRGRRMDLEEDTTYALIKRYREFTSPKGDMRHIPLIATPVIVPKIGTIEQCYMTRQQIIADGLMLRKLKGRGPDERKSCARYHRSFIGRLRDECRNLGTGTSPSPIVICDHIVYHEGQTEEVNREAIRDGKLYKRLRFWDATAHALRIISARQPGKFMLIPCVIDRSQERTDPSDARREVEGNRTGLPQFALPSSIVFQYIQAHFNDVKAGIEITSSPIGGLGDDFRLDDKKAGWYHHSLMISFTNRRMHIECLNMDEPRENEERPAFIPAVGLILPKL